MTDSYDDTAFADGLALLGYNRVMVVPTTGSTNTDLMNLSTDSSVPDMTVLVAGEQSQGRGRQERQFISPGPESQLIFSVLLRLPQELHEGVGLLPLLAGVSLCEVLGRRDGISAKLKWPNDVVVDAPAAAERTDSLEKTEKLAGILVESQIIEAPQEPEVKGPLLRSHGDELAVVIGCGVNYDFPAAASEQTKQAGKTEQTGFDATGIRQLVDNPRSRTEILRDVLLQLAEDLRRWRSLGGASTTVLPRYQRMSATVGKSVTAHLPGGRKITGVAKGVGHRGELLIRAASGTYPVDAADITHLRPA